MLYRSERGAVLMHVAVMLLSLAMFSAIVLDYGVMWASRAQIQTSADAGALAGAIHLYADDPADLAGAKAQAILVGQKNTVWASAPDIQTTDVTFPACPPGTGGGTCIKVDAFRNQGRNNPLPVFFGALWGVPDQGVVGTATAQITSGNAVKCIKPWIVADKWIEGDTPDWDQDDTFTPGVDSYANPGFISPDDVGTELVLKAGTTGDWSAGWTQEIDFGVTGSNAYNEALEGCPDWVPTVTVWDPSYTCEEKTDADPTRGCISVKPGMSAGPTSAGVAAIIASDSTATWAGDHVAGGCMVTHTCVNPNGVQISPRIVPIALFDTADYVTQSATCSGTNCVAKITQIVGFFIQGMCNDVYAGAEPTYCGAHPDKAVVGRFMNYPGAYLSTGGTTTSQFSLMVRLVR